MSRDTATLAQKELAVGDTANVRLDASVRCDKCGAQAYVETILSNGLPLYWCSHHYKEYEQSLLPIMIEKYSELNRLVEDRKKGSEN